MPVVPQDLGNSNLIGQVKFIWMWPLIWFC